VRAELRFGGAPCVGDGFSQLQADRIDPPGAVRCSPASSKRIEPIRPERGDPLELSGTRTGRCDARLSLLARRLPSWLGTR
jgi:hypothetical protein